MQAKYGIRDYRGGDVRQPGNTWFVWWGSCGSSSFEKAGISVHGYTSQVGPIVLNKSYHELNLEETEANVVRCPDSMVAGKWNCLSESAGGTG